MTTTRHPGTTLHGWLVERTVTDGRLTRVFLRCVRCGKAREQGKHARYTAQLRRCPCVRIGPGVKPEDVVELDVPYADDRAAQRFVDKHRGATTEEIARVVGVSHQAIKQIEQRALKKFKRNCRAAGLCPEEAIEWMRHRAQMRDEGRAA